MPPANRFRHQAYSDTKPNADYYLMGAEPGPRVGSKGFQKRMLAVGDLLRGAGVEAVYLVHGTFVGNDAAGLWTELSRLIPAAGNALRERYKQWVDTALGERGNYTARFAELFEQSINAADRRTIPVRLFHWSSENHHVARADAAVRLLAELDRLPHPERILLWGHSHAGNVFALFTNLLGGNQAEIDAFFHAARPYYQIPMSRRIDVPVWREVRERLKTRQRPLGRTKCDFVTFGTPIRYGWDSGGYAGLLHFINHRPVEGLPDYRTRFPQSLDDVLQSIGGDYVQQMGIAGTNVAPGILSWRSLWADRRLNRFLQPDFGVQQLHNRLKFGMRVPEEGTALLVNYGPPEEGIAQHHAGHAVYTQPKWLLFHAEQAAAFFYGPFDTCYG